MSRGGLGVPEEQWFLKDFMSFIVDPHGPGDPIYEYSLRFEGE